jgi:PII-like signaling protein
MLPKDGKLLRIFIGEKDKFEKMPLYEWIVRQARQNDMAGATVLRGIEGFGACSRLHTAKILRLSMDLPIIVEIIDTPEKIESFLPLIDQAITEGIATVEDVHIRFYRGRKEDTK